jgi:hypothetical protein
MKGIYTHKVKSKAQKPAINKDAKQIDISNKRRGSGHLGVPGVPFLVGRDRAQVRQFRVCGMVRGVVLTIPLQIT